jgi:penicillin-binding protein 1A
VAGALLANVRARDIEEGSSTITMQLARNVFPDRIEAQRKTIGRKLLEARVARKIENRFDTDEILELYLNYIYFGGGARGIDAATRLYFDKAPADLTLAEAALLAALPKAPTTYDPRRHPERARERRDLVLDLMAEQERVETADAEAAREEDLDVSERSTPPRSEIPFAPYFVEAVRAQLEERFGDAIYTEPLQIRTTLDRTAQKAAEEELERQLGRIERGNWGRFTGARYSAADEVPREVTEYLQGAIIVLAADTGDALAWVGGRDFLHSRFDRVVDARRQVGSAFKPFVFATALAQGYPLSERLVDRPLELPLDRRRTW